MDILDIHTHHQYSNPFQGILSCTPENFQAHYKGYSSVGFHPWYLSTDDSENWSQFISIVSNPQVLAIGEAGLDKLASVSMDIQEKVFIKQAQIASELNKPLIIHCVKAFNEIIQYKKELNPDVAWIIHGFRGKKELAKQLLDHGFYLSFGERYQEEAFCFTPINRMFMETDESNMGIHQIYEKAAYYKCLVKEKLIDSIQNNIKKLFLK